MDQQLGVRYLKIHPACATLAFLPSFSKDLDFGGKIHKSESEHESSSSSVIARMYRAENTGKLLQN